MGNEYSQVSYKHAHKPKDDGNRSRIVIESAEPESKPRPAQPDWKNGKPDVNDENSYDKNTITPEQMIQSGWTKGKPDTVTKT
jgi:hypothetical protein